MILSSRGDNVGKTSSAVKNKYNAKAYDRITIVVKKEATPKVKEHAEKYGGMSKYIKKLISDNMGGLDL